MFGMPAGMPLGMPPAAPAWPAPTLAMAAFAAALASLILSNIPIGSPRSVSLHIGRARSRPVTECDAHPVGAHE